jgi:hypothetical protein
MRLRSAITAGGVSRPGLRRGARSWWPWNRARPADAHPLLRNRRCLRFASRRAGRIQVRGILDPGGQRLRPPRSIVGIRGVHFRPGQPVRGLAGVQWDTARSGLDGRRNPGRTVRRQTGLRADGGFAQGRRAQDWAGSLEDREDPGPRASFPGQQPADPRGISTDPAPDFRGWRRLAYGRAAHGPDAGECPANPAGRCRADTAASPAGQAIGLAHVLISRPDLR